MTGPTAEHRIHLAERHEIVVPAPEELSASTRDSLIALCERAAARWADERGVAIDTRPLEGGGELGVSFVIVVGRSVTGATSTSAVWSPRWRYWLSVFTTAALRERSATMSAKVDEATPPADIVDLDSRRR